MKVPSWFNDEAVKQLLQIAELENIELRFVGGCVRDFVMGRSGSGDIDLATPCLPEFVMQVFSKHVQVIPTGLAHGTITVMIGKRSFEITTLRRDEYCDGRHAKVAFVDDWRIDAMRRDFTMNALFMNVNGEVIDYVGGIDDAKAGCVRFIGDVRERIREDYLRILRYYRFLATHGSPKGSFSHVIETYENDSILANAHKLRGISAERIATEMQKLLQASNPIPALRLMLANNVWAVISDNAVMDLDNLHKLLQHEIATNPWLRLCALTTSAHEIASSWKLSNNIKKFIEMVTTAPAINDEYQLRLAVDANEHVLAILLLKTPEHKLPHLLSYFQSYQPKPMPITGEDLLANGFKQGVGIKQGLLACKQAWLKSEGNLSKQELLQIAKSTFN